MFAPGATKDPGPQHPEGEFPAWIQGIYYVGLHAGEYQGSPTRREQCVWAFEMAGMHRNPKTGDRFLVCKDTTFSWSDKAHMRKWAEGILGKRTKNQWNTTDTNELHGRLCMVTIEHSSTGRAYVKSVTPWRDEVSGVTIPRPPDAEVDPTETPWLVKFKRNESENAECDTLIEYDPYRYEAPAKSGGQEAPETAAVTTETDESVPF